MELSEGARTALLEYAERGTPRRMDVILESAASSVASVVALDPPPARRPVGWVLVAAAVLAAIVVGVVLVAGSREESAPLETIDGSTVTTVVASTTALLTLADLPEDLREGMVSAPLAEHPVPWPEGWTPYGESFDGQHAMGYVRKADQNHAAEVASEEGRIIPVELYDLPEGTVIGYDLRDLGLVEASLFRANEELLVAEAERLEAERAAAMDQLDAEAQQLLEDGGCSDIRECYEILGPPEFP